MILMVMSQAMTLPPSSLKSWSILSRVATPAFFMRCLTIHFPRPSRFILDRRSFSSAAFLSRWSPQKVKKMEASIPIESAPLAMIGALWTLSMSPLCKMMVTRSAFVLSRFIMSSVPAAAKPERRTQCLRSASC